MTGDKLRTATAAVVVAVAAFAAAVSYQHIYDLGHAHGQHGSAAVLLPLSVDGLILACSMAMLHESRAGRPVPGLARSGLWLGIAATIAANVGYGAAYGLVGALISAWPAAAFILSAETILTIVHRSRRTALSQPAQSVAADAEQAARAALAASIAAGNPLSQRALASRFGLSRARAGVLAREVTASANGHAPEGSTP